MTKPIPNENDERLCDWVDGTMTSRDRERFEAELRVSKTLRDRAEAYRDAVLAVRTGLAVEDEPIDVAASVMARIRSGGTNTPAVPEAVVSPRLPTVPGAWWRSALVAAAMLALIALLDQLEPRVKTTDSAQSPEIVPSTAGLADADDTVRAPQAEPDAVLRRLEQGERSAAVAEPAGSAARVIAPGTTVPQLRLRLASATKAEAPVAEVVPHSPAAGTGQDAANAADKSKDAKPDAAATAASARADRFGGVEVLFGELAASVRSLGPVRLASLARLPGAADNAGQPAPSRAWVVSGTAADVRAFLANVSEASRALGYEVQNSEVEATSVVTRSQPAGPAFGGPSSPGPAGPGVAGGGSKLSEPEVRVVLVIDA
jgi:hypothetical protein